MSFYAILSGDTILELHDFPSEPTPKDKQRVLPVTVDPRPAFNPATQKLRPASPVVGVSGVTIGWSVLSLPAADIESIQATTDVRTNIAIMNNRLDAIQASKATIQAQMDTVIAAMAGTPSATNIATAVRNLANTIKTLCDIDNDEAVMLKRTIRLLVSRA